MKRVAKKDLPPLPRAVWFLRCRGGILMLTPFFTRKEARAKARKGETPVGPFVLAERRGQE